MKEKVATSDIELAEIRMEYDKLYDKIEDSLTEEDKVHLDRAYNMAVYSHRFQRRKSGEPYIYHPLEVARICYDEIGLGPTAVISAVLHDIVEDTPVTIEEVEENFGPKIRKIVDGLTKLDGLYNVEDVESPQAENFKKVLSTLVEDVRVVLIKMADRLHNLRTIASMPRHKQLKIAAETTYVYAPLAHRLGLYNIKSEFQEICFEITNPEIYDEISKKLKETESDRNEYIQEFTDPIQQILDDNDIPYRLTGRPKSISSINNKIITKKVPFEEIYDLFAVRFILDVPLAKEKAICWQVYSTITDIYKPIPERLKDWITTPKSNGYESLHTTVIGPRGRFVEVQIRTERMDEIAERGYAAHWKYKGVKNEENVYDVWIDNVRDILDTNHSNALEFLNDFKTNLFKEEIYVFTPRGDMRILPLGSTALDFAFDIHSDVGYHATAIKVNNRLVPMGQELQNGDQVSVTTNKSQKPAKNWLTMVKTGKARSKIRHAMKEKRRKESEYGQEKVVRKFKSLKINFDTNIDKLVKYLGYSNRVDLYYDVTKEKVNVSDFNKFKVHGNNLILPQKEIIIPAPSKKEKIKKLNKSHILVNGEPASMYEFSMATCCNPILGDDIFAYLSSSVSLKIHRVSCPNALHLMANYGYRILKAEWDTDEEGEFFTELTLIGVDSGVGVIHKITNSISGIGLNIKSFSIEAREGYFEGKVGLLVNNKEQLNFVIKTLSSLEGISNVLRNN